MLYLYNETIFTQELQVNSQIHAKNNKQHTELKVKSISRQTEIVLSCNTYSNIFCFIYNFEKSIHLSTSLHMKWLEIRTNN